MAAITARLRWSRGGVAGEPATEAVGTHAGWSIGNGAWGIADQAVVSLANFLTMVFLARSVLPATFGIFVVVYTALQFANNLQVSAVTRPLNVLGAPLSEEGFRIYTAYAATAQTILATAFTAIALVGAGIAYYLGSDVYALLVALAIALFAWQMQEFVRQVRYTQGRIGEAFVYDLISYGGQAVLIAGLWALDLLSAEGTLYAIGATSALSALYGFHRLKLPSRGFSMTALRPSWHFGKWLLAECLGQWLSVQLFPLLSAAIVGVTAAAYFKAVQNLVAPVHIILNAFQTLVVPRAARIYATGGRHALLAFLIPVTIVAAVPMVAYWAVLGIVGSWLLGVLYSHAYESHSELIWLFSATYLTVHLVQAESIALMSMGNTRAIVVGRVVAVVLTLTAGIALTYQFGIYGTLMGAAVTQLAMGFVLAYQLARKGGEPASVTSTGLLGGRGAS